MIKGLFTLILTPWHALNRRTDMSILWPACKEHARSLDEARYAFWLHASNDDAWTDHYSETELSTFIRGLQ